MPWRNAYRTSIQRHFFLYLLIFLVLVLAGSLAALLLFGGQRAVNDMEILLRKERDYLTRNLEKKFGETSAQAVSLSRELSASIERKIREHSLSISGLSGKPDILTEVLGSEINRLLFALEKTKCSGVFVTLNTTVNSGIKNAEASRAGLYIRNIDHGFMNRNEDQLFLRGPAKIAFVEGFTFHSRWELEFDVRSQPFWEHLLKTREDYPSLPLSRLYYWYFSDNFPGLNEKTVVCSVPLLDKEGNFLGVCGFEIGARKFARDNPLDTNNYANLTSLLFVFSDPGLGQFHPSEALFTGNATLGRELSKHTQLTAKENIRDLVVFKHDYGDACVGLISDISLYPNDSPFAATRFATAIVVPRTIFDGIVRASHLRLILIGVVFLCAGVALCLFLSKRFEKPFKELIDALRFGDVNAKSNIHEIDDLLEFMRSQLEEPRIAENAFQEIVEEHEGNKKIEEHEEYIEKASEGTTEDLLSRFIEKTKTLTRAEADVFNLYYEGYTAQEITSMLNVSANTIKTHNRRIFAKLNVSSRKELLTWVQILTASGRSLGNSDDSQ